MLPVAKIELPDRQRAGPADRLTGGHSSVQTGNQQDSQQAKAPPLIRGLNPPGSGVEVVLAAKDEEDRNRGFRHVPTVRFIQAQQGMDHLHDQFEETTSNRMAHLPFSKTEGPANFPLIREKDLAEQTHKRIRHQIADASSLAVQVQADHISTQIGLLLSEQEAIVQSRW